MNNDDGKLVYTYDLFINGIFGRNRKAKRELFTVAKYLDKPLTDSEAIALMEAKIKDIKLKGSYTYKLAERQGRLKKEGGFEIYTTSLFSDSRDIIAGLNSLGILTAS